MNRKILALIIFVVAVAGIYGLFYAAVTSVLMPQDLNNFKNDLNTMSQIPGINNSDINQIESAAADMEKYSKYMSKDQRTAMANDMKNSNALPPGVLDQNFTIYVNYNYYKALMYNMAFKGDLSSGINNLSSNYEKVSNLSSGMISLNQKAAADLENGDDKAYAEDLRNTALLMKQYNSAMAALKNQLQNVVNQLDS